jgi:hypothetical protein
MLIDSISVETLHCDLSHIVDVMQYCRQFKGLLIKFEASYNDGDEIASFVQSVHKLPLLECLSLEGASIGEEDAIALTRTLFKKQSMKELYLWDSFVSNEAASLCQRFEE